MMGPGRCDLGGALRTALGRRQGQWPPRRGAARGSIKVPCPLYLAAGLTAGSGTGRPGHSPPRWPQHLPLAWLTAESGSLRFPELGCRDRGERDRPGAGSTKPAARSRQRDSSQCRTQIDGNHSQRPGKCQGGPGLRHRVGGGRDHGGSPHGCQHHSGRRCGPGRRDACGHSRPGFGHEGSRGTPGPGSAGRDGGLRRRGCLGIPGTWPQPHSDHSARPARPQPAQPFCGTSVPHRGQPLPAPPQRAALPLHCCLRCPSSHRSPRLLGGTLLMSGRCRHRGKDNGVGKGGGAP